MRVLICLRRHSYAEWLQLVVGLGMQLPQGGIIALVSERFDERNIELMEPLDEGIAHLSSNGSRP